MYKIALATTDEEILEFEKMRTRVFNQKNINKKEEGAYSRAIERGEMLALECLEDQKLVGGSLLSLQGKNLEIVRLFTDENQRGKGIGSLLIEYIKTHQDYFEDYYGTEIRGVVTEPLESSIDYYHRKGFDGCGSKMYTKYVPKKQGR